VTRLRIVQGARGEFGLVPLHRGVRRIPFEHMAHHDPDAAFVREGDAVWNELREYCEKHPLPRPARHYRIGFNPHVRWGERLVVSLVFGVICFCLVAF
jgi:hypothetical protein